jgi:hypothetical protein
MRKGLVKFLCCLVSLLAVGATPVHARAADAKSSFEGKLGFLPGTGPVLEAKGRNITLSARTSYLFHTLGDERLRNREVRLEGTRLPDGSFKVEQLLTVHNGKLYRVRYFCEVCNIEAYEPGICVCCQQPTELQEIPLDENDKQVIVTK